MKATLSNRTAFGRRSTALLSIALFVAVSACSSGESGDDVAAPLFNRGLTDVRNQSAETGGTLRLVAGQIDSLDPSRSSSAGVWNIMRLYTRQLVTYAPAPGEGGTKLAPDLATALGVPSKGGRVWTYTIRKGLSFEDGTPITSREIKYGIERQFASDVITGGPFWAVDALDDSNHTYLGPYRDTRADKLGLTSVETPNPETIIFRLNRPFSDWDYVMALPLASPVPPAKDTKADYAQHPISSGPYQIAANNNGVVTFERNTHWSREADPLRLALPDTIELFTGLSAADRDQRILSGKADADVTGTGVLPKTAKKILANKKLKDRSDDPVTNALQFLAASVKSEPFNNGHCRQAVQFAVNKAAVKKTVGGDYAALVATTLWTRTIPGYPATTRYASGDGNQGDVEKAKAQLRECGKAGGFSTKIATVDTPQGLAIANDLRRSLARVKINAEVVKYPQATFLLSDVGSPEAAQKAGIGLIVSSWTTDFPRPTAVYMPLTDSRSIRPKGNTNLAELSDQNLRPLADQATTEVNVGASNEIWRRYDSAVMDSAAYVPLVEGKALQIGSARLHNAYIHPQYRGYDVVSLGVS